MYAVLPAWDDEVILVLPSIVSFFFLDTTFRIRFFVIFGRYVLFVLLTPPYFLLVYLVVVVLFLIEYRVLRFLKRGILAGKRGCSWRETRTRESAVVVSGVHFAEYPDG